MLATITLSVWHDTSAFASSTIIVTTTNDDLDPDAPCDESVCTLRAAIRTAQPGTEISLPAGTYQLDEQLVIADSLTLRGESASSTRIEPSVGEHRLIDIPDGASGHIEIRNLTLANGGGATMTDHGAGIRHVGPATLAIRSAAFVDNDSSGASGTFGGAIYAGGTASHLSIRDTQFQRNRSAGGGAIYVTDGVQGVEVHRSVFTENTSAGILHSGGALLADSVHGLAIDISRSEFSANSAGASGGAINFNGAVDIAASRVMFRGNSAALGGAIYGAGGASANLTNALFEGNAGSGSVVAMNDAASSATLAFATILDHTDAFVALGGATIGLEHSAATAVAGCAGLTSTTSSLFDDMGDADCRALSSAPATDLQLDASIKPPHPLPAPGSPLLAASVSGCPSTDLRGIERSEPCAVGAYDPAGVVCPSGTLPRDEAISCELDVALSGAQTHVLVQFNPTLFDGPVALTEGAGQLSFTVPSTHTTTAVEVQVAGGAYSHTLAVTDLGGSGGGGGGSGGGGGTSPPSNPATEAGGTPAHAEEAGSRGDLPDQLAFTGTNQRGWLIIAALAIVIGSIRVRTAVRATVATPDGTSPPDT